MLRFREACRCFPYGAMRTTPRCGCTACCTHRIDRTIRDVYGVMLKDYPDVMNIEEMSRALGVSTKTGYKLLRTGKITAKKVGRTYRIPKVHLLTYLRVLDADRAS